MWTELSNNAAAADGNCCLLVVGATLSRAVAAAERQTLDGEMTSFRIEFLAPMGNPEPYLDELVDLWRWEQAADGRVIVSPHRRNVIEQIEQELKNQEQLRRLRFERVD